LLIRMRIFYQPLFLSIGIAAWITACFERLMVMIINCVLSYVRMRIYACARMRIRAICHDN
jgi:hypothetical protein